MDAGQLALANQDEAGRQLLLSSWPHVATTRSKRSVKRHERLRIFRLDGYRCRYTGDRLFLPAYLTALAVIWPNDFPTHPHGKAEETHSAFWSHFPSIDHVDPIATGGVDTEDNWITTSMARNQVRSRHSLESLGWSVRPREPTPDWDGGVEDFLRLVEQRPGLLSDTALGAYLRSWHTAVQKDLAGAVKLNPKSASK